MNKHLYRIIFNQARGLLMVVAEIARSGRESGRRVRPGQKTAVVALAHCHARCWRYSVRSP
jgi:filamentous hemagglutinin